MALTLLDIENLSSAEYAKKMNTDPAFAAEVNALLKNPPRNPVASSVPVEETPAEVAPVAALPAPAPAPAPAPVVDEVPEKRYEWQPTDENDRPLGGRQVILYRTEQEKFDKVIAANNLLIRQLRKVNREKALGSTEDVPTDAERFQNVTEFKPRELSAADRFKIAEGLTNPETFADARDQLIESAFGVTPAKLASTLNETQRFIIQQRAVENYIDFVNATGVYDSMNNRQVLTGWLGKRNLAPTVTNFQIALNQCRQSGLIEDAPVVQQVTQPTPAPAPVAEVPVVPVVTEPNPQAPVAATPGLGSEPQPQAKRHSHVPSGLNASIASAAGPLVPVEGSSVTLETIDKMPAEVFKQWMKVPANRALNERLEQEAATRRRSRHLSQ
jgi:hypothetical protein